MRLGDTTHAVCPADSEVWPAVTAAGKRTLQHTTASAVMRDAASCVMSGDRTRATTRVSHVDTQVERVKRTSHVNVQVKLVTLNNPFSVPCCKLK